MPAAIPSQRVPTRRLGREMPMAPAYGMSQPAPINRPNLPAAVNPVAAGRAPHPRHVPSGIANLNLTPEQLAMISKLSPTQRSAIADYIQRSNGSNMPANLPPNKPRRHQRGNPIQPGVRAQPNPPQPNHYPPMPALESRPPRPNRRQARLVTDPVAVAGAGDIGMVGISPII